MNWWQLLLLWFGTWLATLILNFINISKNITSPEVLQDTEDGLKFNAHVIFRAGLVCFLINVVGFLFDFQILHWILLIGGAALNVPSIFAIGSRSGPNSKRWIDVIATAICRFSIIAMVANIYFVHLI